jgi:hypothetical protein
MMDQMSSQFQVSWWPDFSHKPQDALVVDSIEDALLRTIEFSRRSCGTTCVRTGAEFLDWVLVTKTKEYSSTSVWFEGFSGPLSPFHRSLLRVLYSFDENLHPL